MGIDLKGAKSGRWPASGVDSSCIISDNSTVTAQRTTKRDTMSVWHCMFAAVTLSIASQAVQAVCADTITHTLPDGQREMIQISSKKIFIQTTRKKQLI